MCVSEHERIRVSLASASAASSSSTEEAHMRLLESAYLLSNLSVERAAALFSSTSAAMMEMGQHFLSVPPTVWNGLVQMTPPIPPLTKSPISSQYAKPFL